MNAITTLDYQSLISIDKNQPVTTSIEVAKAFKKTHSDVLRKIDDLLTQVIDFSFKRNFALIEIETKVGYGTRKDRAYQMTKDGFMLLVMGFTGKQAIGIKIAYIEAFNWMAEKLFKKEIPALTINKQQQYQIKEAVTNLAGKTGRTFQSIYRSLYNKFQIPRYQDLLAKDFYEAMKFLENIPKIESEPNFIIEIPFDLRDNKQYRVVVHNGKVRRSSMSFASIAEDTGKPWDTL